MSNTSESRLDRETFKQILTEARAGAISQQSAEILLTEIECLKAELEATAEVYGR